MKKIDVFFLVLFLVVLNACQHSQPTSVPNKDWSQETKHELEFVRSQIKNLHPAFAVKLEQSEKKFLHWFESGYEQALLRSEKVRSFSGMYFTIRAFTVGFEDEHLLAGLNSFDTMKANLPSRWPLFILKSNQDHRLTVVRFSEVKARQPLPAEGSELISCDGISVTELLNQNVFPFYGNQKLEKNWILYAPRVFVDLGNPHIQLPKKCQFKESQKITSYDLNFEPIALEDLWPRLNGSLPQVPPIKTFFSKNWFWFKVPTFAPNEDQSEVLRKAISELATHRKNHVVVDLRGNSGGSSSWGTEILETLYGKEFIDAIKWKYAAQTRERYEYRVSKMALEYFRNILGDKNKNVSITSPFFAKVLARLEDAYKTQKKTISVTSLELESQPKREAVSLLKYPLIVITDEYCFSACLSFLDLVRAIPKAIHVGKVTSGDTVFMQTLDDIPFEGGAITLTVPIVKVHNRKRKNNEPYTPHKIFLGEMSDDSQLEHFVRGL